MDNMIFCLETEWEQSIHDMKYESQARPLLEFLYNSNGIGHIFRQVATKEEFDYYISHLARASYKNYGIVYLCFHGNKGNIAFADNGKFGSEAKIELMDFAEENQGIFEGKVVHFGSCSTFKVNEEEIKSFKSLTKASMVSGYQKDVEMTGSFIFEAWLLNALYSHPNYRAKRLLDLAQKEMPYFIDKYKFVAY